MSDERRKPTVVVFPTDPDFYRYKDQLTERMNSSRNQNDRIEALLWVCLRFLFAIACRHHR